MEAFKPLNLAQLYQGADAAVAQAMQTNLLVLQTSKMKQEFDEEDQLRTLAKTSLTNGPDGTPTMDLKAYARGAYGISPTKGMAITKSIQEQEKTALERENVQGQIDERRMKGAADRLKHMNEASTVPFLKYKELVEGGMPEAEARAKVQPLHVTAITNLQASGLFTQEQMKKFDLRPEFDPIVAEAGMRQVLGAKDQLAEYWEKKKFGETMRHNKATEDQAKKTGDETARHNRVSEGQGYTRINLEREKAGIEKLGTPTEVTVDGKPIMAAFDKTNRQWIDTNSGEVVKVTPKDADGTDGERLASGFAGRMTAAEKILGGIKSGEQKSGIIEGVATAVPFVGETIANELRGEDRQKALQAQRDWVRAKLRKESGAAIGEKEMEDEIKTYFPQVGDGKKVIEQKKEARARAGEAMIQSAGRAYKAPKDDGTPARDDKVTPVKVASEADYAKVPAGAQYIDPQGVLRTKRKASD